jgi:hypothetical protein
VVLARPFFFITTGYFFTLEIILSISRIFFDESIARKQTPVKVPGRLSPPEEALTDIETALKIIESLRTKIASPELRTSYFATVQDSYQFYIDLLMQLHKTQPKSGYDTKAFEASERSRARSLLELLQEANADIRQGVAPELLQRERNLQQQLDALEKQRIEVLSRPNNTPAQKAELEQQRQNLLTQSGLTQTHYM